MTRILFILNPLADHGHAADQENRLKRATQDAIESSEKSASSYHLTWVRTEAPGHATDLAQNAANNGHEVVVAVGGDGTVHEVVNGLMGIPADSRPQMGIIPAGSGNDFAHNLGLPNDPSEAIRCVLSNTTRKVDIGTIRDGSGRQEYWDNTVGIGFSGLVNIATRKHLKLRGFMIYFVSVLETILFHPPALQAVFRIDERSPFEQPISMLSVCNGPREGGGFPVAPNAIMDDGLITYMIMKKLGRLGMLRFLPVVMNAKHLKHTRFFSESTASTIQITTGSPMAVHTDGEIYSRTDDGITELQFGIVPGALSILCGCD
nr:diacylglycerol kinase family lipid kinase [Anaerolineae bacterium]